MLETTAKLDYFLSFARFIYLDVHPRSIGIHEPTDVWSKSIGITLPMLLQWVISVISCYIWDDMDYIWVIYGCNHVIYNTGIQPFGVSFSFPNVPKILR